MSAHHTHGPGLRVTIAIVGLAQVLILCIFLAWLQR